MIQKLVWAIASPSRITRSGAATVVWLSCERVNVAWNDNWPGLSQAYEPPTPGPAQTKTLRACRSRRRCDRSRARCPSQGSTRDGSRGVVVAGELDVQVAQRLIRRLAVGNAHQVFAPPEPPPLGVCPRRAGGGPPARLSAPPDSRGRVSCHSRSYLRSVGCAPCDAAEDHAAEPAIADRQRIAPSLGGVPYHSTGSRSTADV